MVIVAVVATADDDGNMLLGQLLHSPLCHPDVHILYDKRLRDSRFSCRGEPIPQKREL